MVIFSRYGLSVENPDNKTAETNTSINVMRYGFAKNSRRLNKLTSKMLFEAFLSICFKDSVWVLNLRQK